MPPPDAPERSAAPRARLRVERIRPAYRQVADELRKQIVGGLLPAGHRLQQLAEQRLMDQVAQYLQSDIQGTVLAFAAGKPTP